MTWTSHHAYGSAGRAPNEDHLRTSICEIGGLMYQKGWVAANDGNISVRLNEDEILCTPTNVSKGMMKPDDLIVVDSRGGKVRGLRERTSEIRLHLAIYDQRPEIQAIVHAHPPLATGFAVAGRALNLAILPEVIVTLGSIPLADYGLPGTASLIDPLLPYIPNYDAILMANHGAVAYANELWQAFFRMETVEHVAKITLVAETLGGPQLLSRQQVQELFDSRARYGVSTRNVMTPGHPVVAEDVEGQARSSPRELASLLSQALGG